MKVSIIIPTYNVEAYITECLESVARQTYQGVMECLIVDDCGTDNSILIAEKFIQSYHGRISFEIIRREENGGLSAARNTGVENAVGDYVYFLDSDDAILPETIDEMAKVVREHPLVEMVQGGIVSMNGQIIDDFTNKNLPIYTDDTTWIAKNLFFNLPVSSWNRLIKKDFLEKECILFHEGIIHEDVPYCYLLTLKCRFVGFVKKNTYLYRQQREGSILNSSKEERSLQSRLTIIHDCIDAYKKHTFSIKELQNIALKNLWKKWQDYIAIHSPQTLRQYDTEISNISSQLCSITPVPWKMIALIYKWLPLSIKRKIKI